MSAGTDGRKEAPRLTARELSVVELVVEGLTDAEIGHRVHLSERTVHGHVANARRKVSARSRTHLAVIALRTGIVPLHPDGEEVG
jgi:DNA-binding NarL/FixJ family response regulator